MKSISSSRSVLVCFLSLALGATACGPDKEESPGEQTEDAFEEGGEDVEEGVEETGDEIDDATDD